MRAEVLKQVVCLVAGVGIGVFLTYDRLNKQYNEQLAELESENDSQKSELLIQIKNLKEALELSNEPVDIPADPEPSPLAEAAATAMTSYTPARINPLFFAKDFYIQGEEDRVEAVIPDHPDLPEFMKPTPEEIGAMDFVPNEEPPRVYVPPTRNPIQVITAEQFSENGDDYDERDLTYWAKDKVLSDEHDNEVEKRYHRVALGRDVKDLLEAGPPFADSNENTVYIRHTALKEVMAVTWREDSFAAVVKGE